MKVLAILLVAAPLWAQPTVIRAGKLLDPVTGVIKTNQFVIIDGARIRSIGEGSVGSDAQVIDLSAYTVLPGLIDAHVHLGIGGMPRDNAAAIVRAGFTTVLDLGARTTRVLRIRDTLHAGEGVSPRVLGAGIWIGTKGGVCEFGGIGIAGGPEGFRARVVENVGAGADVIKACVTGWPGAAYASPDAVEIADDALDALVREAHASRKQVVAHAIGAGGVRASMQAGVNGLAHTAYVDSALAIAMAQKGMFMISTLASLTGGDTSAPSRALIRAAVLAHRAGVPLVFGTDGGVLPHGQNAREFAALVEAGISPLDALRSATVVAARALQLQDSVGRIAPGFSADLLAVEGDPLVDVGALERVRFVMTRGRVVRSPAEPR